MSTQNTSSWIQDGFSASLGALWVSKVCSETHLPSFDLFLVVYMATVKAYPGATAWERGQPGAVSAGQPVQGEAHSFAFPAARRAHRRQFRAHLQPCPGVVPAGQVTNGSIISTDESRGFQTIVRRQKLKCPHCNHLGNVFKT